MKKIFKLTITSNIFDIKFEHIFNRSKKHKLKCPCGGNLLSESDSKTNLRCSLCNKSYILIDENTLIEP